jgi:hypothetical protein
MFPGCGKIDICTMVKMLPDIFIFPPLGVALFMKGDTAVISGFHITYVHAWS